MKNKVALITGGAGHIGSETCRKLAEHGCNIVIVDKNLDVANSFSDELKANLELIPWFFR